MRRGEWLKMNSEPEYKRGDVISVIGLGFKWVVDGYNEECYNGKTWYEYNVLLIEKTDMTKSGYRLTDDGIYAPFDSEYAHFNIVLVGTWDFDGNMEVDDDL